MRIYFHSSVRLFYVEAYILVLPAPSESGLAGAFVRLRSLYVRLN
jgi:hypothetical protein